MNNSKNARKKVFANKLHREIFLIVFAAAVIPTIVITAGLYCLIFEVVALQLGIPEAIAYNILPAAQKVLAILSIAVPIVIIIILLFAHKVAHTIVGPFDRIIRELDESLEGKKDGHIVIRKSDKFCPLVERINKLLDRPKTGER